MKKIITALAFFCFLFVNQSKASHIAGGDLSYVCLGGGQYQINLNLFVDCLGFDPGNTQPIDFVSTCGGTANATVNCLNPGGTEISQLCPSQLNNSTCNGGPLPGMWVFHYTGTVSLLPACDTWNMSWNLCCRNNAILNITNASSFGSYIEATMNSVTDSCNNSPAFTAQPIPYVCINQQVNYSYGVVETDGDSLYYSLVDAMDYNFGTGTPFNLTYAGGYSGTSPMPGMVINPNTGALLFTPTTLGNFVVVVLVQEYDSNGNLIGTVMRDIQFIVQNCSNSVPDPTGGAITGMTGSAVQTGPFSIELCEGSNFNFSATYTDSNPGDVLSLISNIATVLPGSVVTTSGTNPLTANISWTAPAGSANTNTTFSVTINDGACPVPGQQTFVYDIQVQPRTLGGPDQIICGPQTATMHATGGSSFTWAVIAGHPMVVGTNFSCNNCADPVASPDSTTVYEVTSNLSGTCLNKDTVTITVVPDFSFVSTQSTPSLCLQQTVQFSTVGSPAGTYTYLWSPGANLDTTTAFNPIATLNTAGTYSFYVNITSPFGCMKKDTLTALVQNAIRTDAFGDTVLCGPQSAPLSATGGTNFTWTAIAGPALVAGTNISCINCANPIATPTATTTYVVTSDLTGTCINKDTVTITVVPDYTVTTTQQYTITCLANPAQFNASSSPVGTYSYSWSPSTYLNNAGIANPVATITSPGTYTYTVTTQNSAGCVKQNPVIITITPTYAPDPTLSATSPACVGDSILLSSSFGSPIPTVCGMTPVMCAGTVVATVGAGGGSNTTTSYPAPYGNWYTTVKQQFLYTAAELNAVGITGGKIDQIDFDVTTINGISTYHFFSISMGCTGITGYDQFAPVFETGLFNVYPPQTYTIANGWNTHPFTNAFEWDGVSNVVIEVCFNELNPGSNWTNNSISTNTPTTNVSSVARLSDSDDQCSLATGFTQTANAHPMIRVHYCGGAPDISNFTYTWTPPATMATPNAQNTEALITVPTTYTLVAVDGISGCSGTDVITVTPIPTTTITVSAGNDPTICPGASTTLGATGATTYVWTPATALSSTTIPNPVATPTVTTTYTVTGSAQCAPNSTDVVTVFAVNSVILTVDAGSDVTVCPGVPTQLTATGATNYTWSPAASLSNPSVPSPFASPLVTTTYTVIGTAFCANPVADSVTVNITPTTGPLTANAGSNETVCQGEPFTLNGTTNGGYGNNSYTWADVAGPGADSMVFSSALSTSLISGSTGVYTYQLEITDQCGYVAFDTVMIDVSLDCSLTIPNIFTPNGDGVNDKFEIHGNGLKSYSIMIYNRWGEKVFESTDIMSPWTGGGKQDGTYYYILKAETSNGKLFEKQGYIQLLSN